MDRSIPRARRFGLAYIVGLGLTLSIASTHSTAIRAQSASDEATYARSPKEIPFQNDSQWEDNRWQLTDVGPFLSGSILAGGHQTLKGIAIRVGDQGQAAVCFDTARLRISHAWTGEFLQFDARRFGLVRPPEAAGELFCSTPKIAGWAKAGRFKHEPDEIANPTSVGYEKGNSETNLPKDWAHYRGLYTSGRRVVLSYSVGHTDVLESPWYVQVGTDEAFIRSLEIGPSADEMRMLMASGDASVFFTAADSIAADSIAADAGETGRVEGISMEEQSVLRIAPHDSILRIQILVCKPNTPTEVVESLRYAAGAIEDLRALMARDSGRFPEELTTVGTTHEATNGPYVIDTLTLPFDNPWNALFFTSGHDFFSDGRAAICTIQGDVWVLSGIDRDLLQLRWRRFATGLYQPLGLKIVDDKVFVIGRDQLTRLHDNNGDGEADYYENFNNDLIISPRSHNFVTCLDTDSAKNFYFIHAISGVMRVSADGSQLTTVADGFRNPNGMAVGPDGTITAAPQQGTWTPESSLIVVREGGYYGFGGPRMTDTRPSGWDLPMCFIPRDMDNSGGAQVWVEGGRWGPLDGRMLHLSYGQCRMLLALTEDVDGVTQGGTIKFPTTPSDFESGIMRGRFRPQDGQLYVSGLRGWQSRAIRDGCFQRVRYTGGPVHLPIAVKTFTNGIQLSFSARLDQEFAENVDNYYVQQWNYAWSKEYGSPDYSIERPQEQGRDEVNVVSATLLDDGRSVFLEMPGRQVVNQLSISWLLRSSPSPADVGTQFRGTFAHTINAEPKRSMPESVIVRRPRAMRIAEDVQQRLQPGLRLRFTSLKSQDTDVRTARLVALSQSVATPPTPFLAAGAFSLDMAGTLNTTHSGFYEFKLESSGPARLWLNDQLLIDGSPHSASTEAKTTTAPILVHKGHNPLRIDYTSPAAGEAQLRLLWKGSDFDWEPLPPNVLFHDSGEPALLVAQQRRLGRQLFVDHHCAACHQTGAGDESMFELSLAAPDLSAVGVRFETQWLTQWLGSPRSLRPQATMPAMLGDGPQAGRDAADIAAFLTEHAQVSRADEPRGTATAELPLAAAVSDGARLYEQLGCIACHHFEEPASHDEFERLSLYYANAKFARGALSAFLVNPTADHPSIRMPDFQLSTGEAAALAAYIRQASQGTFAGHEPIGEARRGAVLFESKGCRQCHSLGEMLPLRPPPRVWSNSASSPGCLAEESPPIDGVPAYGFSKAQREFLREFVEHDLASLGRAVPVELATRLFDRLQCANCHDRDGLRSHRAMVIVEEGSGIFPESLPQLTWAGEKLRGAWTHRLLAGELTYKSRPWIAARMPAYAAYARAMAHGLAAEHAIDFGESPAQAVDSDLAATGQQLALPTGLDCRQCHAIGDQQPLGDQETKLAQGINFSFIRERLRYAAYQRFMIDPPRYDLNTKMIRLSEDGLTTKLKSVFDADAHRQFEALWHYMQSLPSPQALGLQN